MRLLLLLLLYLLYGGFRFLTSGGDPKSAQEAKGRITNAIVGLVILLSFFAITQLLETFFGISIIQLNLEPLFLRP